MDAYPYFQSTMANSIGNANKTFYDALAATKAASKGKPVWVTETGWPVIGDTLNQAVANAANAKIYWQDVACSLGAANVNFYWYMLQEAQYGNPNPDFGIKGPGDLMQIQPRYDLTCSAKVSTLPSYLLLSILSPLFILLLYNIALISSLASRLLPVKEQCCQCDCMPSTLPVVHPTIWPRKLVDWHARSNGFAKSLNSSVPTPTGTEIPSTCNDLSVPLPLSQCTDMITALSISISTTASEPTIIWPPTPIPLVTPDSPVTPSPVIMPDPFSSIAPEPLTLTGPFEFPHLVVPIDNANPDTVIGSQYVARLSPTYSSLYNFDVRPSYAGKTCSLVFHLPLLSGDWWQLIQYKSAGGIIVSQLNNIATDITSASKVGNTRPIGSVSSLSPGGGYTINSAPCEAGKTVGYRIDAVGGLDLQYFQMVTPPTGLFMTASD
jgi:glucan endo-1,3-beta-D-glucosidase